jgi:hypothetical protein
MSTDWRTCPNAQTHDQHEWRDDVGGRVTFFECAGTHPGASSRVVTAEGSTGAPLRQQIAEAIHAETCNEPICDEDPTSWERQRHLDPSPVTLRMLSLPFSTSPKNTRGATTSMRIGDCTMNEVESCECVAADDGGLWRSVRQATSGASSLLGFPPPHPTPAARAKRKAAHHEQDLRHPRRRDR